MEDIRVRIAPSPTGYLHIGNARTALYNWLFARKHNGKFILRIEDTDVERSTQDAIQVIMDSLKWLGLDWDEGPFFQSQRLDIYNQYIDKLIQDDKAYRCFCTSEELDKLKQEAKKKKQQYQYNRKCRNLSEDEIKKNLSHNRPHVVRLIKQVDEEITFHDLIKGEIRIHSDTIDDFIIKRTDGYPVYNFAVVIDDALMKITHVIRGDDHVSNTPKQILLYRSLGFNIPVFAHLPMIIGEDKARLSKRHGATSVQDFKQKGFLPEAMCNYLARLGWSFDDSQEIFSIQELIEKFSLEKVSKNPAIFNYQKLEWLNSVYMQKLNINQKIKLAVPYLIKCKLIDNKFAEDNHDFLIKVIKMIGDRFKTFEDIIINSDFLFKETLEYSENVKEKLFNKIDLKNTYHQLIKAIESIGTWDKDSILKTLDDLSQKVEIKRKDFYQALRAALTGRLISPDLLDILLLMGKEKTLHKIKSTLDFISH